jgi:hypothetical protein
MGKQHENPEGIGTQRLPGTGGDLAPTDQDVEGHRRPVQVAMAADPRARARGRPRAGAACR